MKISSPSPGSARPSRAREGEFYKDDLADRAQFVGSLRADARQLIGLSDAVEFLPPRRWILAGNACLAKV